MKSIITVSRKWDNPKITTTLSDEEIKLQCKLTDFLNALKTEIGSTTFTVTKSGFNKQFDKAVERVLQGIKEESAKVVN